MTTTSVTSDDYSSAILSSLASTDSTSTSSDAEELYNTWISLLATQLQNQDPTDPVDTAEFTSQLVSLSSLEQQALTNETLSSLLTTMEGIEGQSLASYLGMDITAYGDTVSLSGGTADWEYELSSEADEVVLSVMDEDGNVVYTTEGDTSAGKHGFTWDGTTSGSETAADGAYQLVVEAVDADGDEVSTTTYACGTVTSVDMTADSPTLLMGDVEVPLSYLISVSAAA